MIDFVVVQTHPSMIDYVDHLQRKNAEALSFYPRQVFEREQDNGRLFLGLLNGEPCGYLYVGANSGNDVKCHQVCIEYDARRRLYGAAIVAVMEHYAQEGLATSITLRCGFDLEANDFWSAAGYSCIAHQPGGIRRLRTINIWRKQLRPELFDTLAIEPAVGKVDATIWRRNKSTGLVTQFVRGKSMQNYRAKLIAEDRKGNPMTDDAKARLREAIAWADDAPNHWQNPVILRQIALLAQAARQSLAAEDGRKGGYFVPAMGEFCKHGMYPHCPQCAKDTPK